LQTTTVTTQVQAEVVGPSVVQTRATVETVGFASLTHHPATYMCPSMTAQHRTYCSVAAVVVGQKVSPTQVVVVTVSPQSLDIVHLEVVVVEAVYISLICLLL
jgi:hypothetical protein